MYETALNNAEVICETIKIEHQSYPYSNIGEVLINVVIRSKERHCIPKQEYGHFIHGPLITIHVFYWHCDILLQDILINEFKTLYILYTIQYASGERASYL